VGDPRYSTAEHSSAALFYIFKDTVNLQAFNPCLHSTTKYLNGHSERYPAESRSSATTTSPNDYNSFTIGWSRRRPLRRMAGAPRNQDVAPPHAPSRLQRPARRGLARQPPRRRGSTIPDSPRTRITRSRTPDERLRRDGQRRDGHPRAKPRNVLERVRIFTLAESTRRRRKRLVNYPAVMTHASIPADRRPATRHHGRLDSLLCGFETETT